MQKEIRLKIANIFNFTIRYIKNNLIISIVAFYIGLSIILNVLFPINIMIPCVWKTIFHHNCIGCGLTSASIKIIQFDFTSAYVLNPLIFVVFPLIIIYFITDIYKFYLRNKKDLKS